MEIGYIGLGNMGGALAQRLVLSFPIRVSDRSENAVARLVEAGGVASDAKSIAGQCDVVFLCLPTSGHVREVLFGEGGIANAFRQGTIVIDQTTGDPNETREMAKELAASGVKLVDAPVSGGAAGAKAGTIAIMVGADQETFDSIVPLLNAISPNIFHAGGVGNGHVIKLVNNLLSCVQRLLSFEAMTLAAKNGVDPKVAQSIIMASGGRNAYFEKVMGPRVLEGKLNIGFTLGLAHKDVRLACELGDASGVATAFGDLSRGLYDDVIRQYGNEAQVDTVGLYLDEMAGTSVVPAQHDLMDVIAAGEKK